MTAGPHGPAGTPPAFLDAVDLALLFTYCTAWLAAIAALAA